ncbi:MAG: HAMP domain-containing protein [Candidatus Aminicenantes bacterium]|nr:HAMP domain-containing protein [Candidatus Aminicenantes bacterium]
MLSFLLPRFYAGHGPQKSLRTLRRQAELVKREYSALELSMTARLSHLAGPAFPNEENQVFALFRALSMDPNLEGIAYYNEDAFLEVWMGNVIDFRPSVPGISLLVRNRASVYLVFSARIRESEQIVLFRLLAFRPRLRTPFLSEYHFLKGALGKSGHIEYWDFRDDVSGFEKIFTRHNDEYLGEPHLDSEVRQVFFPLRNQRREIVATVNLTSPSLRSLQSQLREMMILLFAAALALALSLLVIDLARLLLSTSRSPSGSFPLFVLALAGLRAVLMLLSRLEWNPSKPAFSPAQAGFISWRGLTQSPADIFLSALSLGLIVAAFILFVRRLIRVPGRTLSLGQSWLMITFFSSVAFGVLTVYHGFIADLTANSNINLLRFSGDASFLLLHFGIVFMTLSCGGIVFLALDLIRRFSRHWMFALPPLVWTSGIYIGLAARRSDLIPSFVSVAIVALGLPLLALAPKMKKQGIVFALILLAALFNSTDIRLRSSARFSSLVQNFLRDTILAQEDWADFIIQQSLPEIDKKQPAVLSFLRNPDASPLARSLWESTLAAKFNWYSILEVSDAEGAALSRFSLNIPQLYQPEIELPLNPDWTVSRLNVPSLGKEREFILAYKDWFEEDTYLGRTAFSLAVDPEMLPFLYSANPYFELLKVSRLPSLHQQEFGFAIFNEQGHLLFNPHRMTSGITGEVMDRIKRSPQGVWLVFRDKGRTYDSFNFPFQNKVYSFFIPCENILGLTVEFLKLAIFYLALTFLFLLFLPSVLRRRRGAALLWSFSSRVYTAFITVAVISLFLFTLFSHRFFIRTFSQHFQEKAEIHANLARNIMQDFISLQQEEKATLIAPTDDLVLWISSAIATDVNLYGEGRLISSSRREFFDWGLLPDLIDGETFYRIRNENKPFSIQRQKIGEYSFQSLTIPYTIQRSQFLISLPFPFEAQEIAGATEELIEFLVFVSAFLILGVSIFARGIGRMIISPVRKLLTGTREVGLGNLEISIEHRSHDEMKTLVDGFNAMIKDLKRHQQEIADLGKKVAWAEMAQKVAHEIKNPLTPIQLSAEHILRVYEDKSGDFEPALRESASYIISEVENLRRIAQEFLALSRVASLKKGFFDLKEAVGEVVTPYRNVISERIRFREIFEGKDFRVEADKSKIKIAVRNIFINAIEAIRDKGEIEIRMKAEADRLSLSVRDSGLGMAKDVVDRIFDSYFSTKDVGTGLGLPIAKKIVEDHGGTIRVESEVQKGTTITIFLPRKT